MRFVKFILVVISIAVVLCALLFFKGMTSSDRLLHKMVFIETGEDWLGSKLTGCEINESQNSVKFPGSKIEDQNLITKVIDAGFDFNQLILSWNIDINGDLRPVVFEVEVSPDNKDWYLFDYLTWGSEEAVPGKGVKKIDNIGKVNVDVLKFYNTMRYVKIHMTVPKGDYFGSLSLRRLSLALSSENPNWNEYLDHHGDINKPEYSSFAMAVPFINQRTLEANKSGGACSPTATGMALQYHDTIDDVNKFAWEARDYINGIFGNWPYNIQAAYASGLTKAWVERHCGFDEIYEEVASGKPVVISIAYGYDELPNSPIHEAEVGHLITVIGFAGPDTVICNDPAGHSVDDGIIKYPREELEKFWIGHTGVAYHLWP